MSIAANNTELLNLLHQVSLDEDTSIRRNAFIQTVLKHRGMKTAVLPEELEGYISQQLVKIWEAIKAGQPVPIPTEEEFELDLRSIANAQGTADILSFLRENGAV